MKNRELAEILSTIALYLELENEPFKRRAYERAAEGVSNLTEDIRELYRRAGRAGPKELQAIPGVGVHIAQKIEEFIRTGRIDYLLQLKKRYPPDLKELTSIEGVGAKTALKLFQKLAVKNLKDLEAAAAKGKIRSLKGFGVQSEKKILRGISFQKTGRGRLTLGEALPLAEELAARLQGLPEIKKMAVAGSIRRRRETVGDIDLLVAADRAEPIIERFVHWPEVSTIYARGKTKALVRLRTGLDADLRVVPTQSFGAALNYFTGSKDHSVILRKLAQKKGLKLDEYGLWRHVRGSRPRLVAGRDETELYRALNLPFIEPELRENLGEIEAARENRLPRLLGYQDLQGDLQTHSDWSDGKNTIKEMALAARRLGHRYLLVTDHTRSLRMTGGADEKKLLRQMAVIDRLNRELGGRPRILKGAEVNILKNGALDIADPVLAKLDIVGGAIHSHFNLDKQTMTKRLNRAMENPHLDIVFHPSGRIINRRPGYELDWEGIFKTARKTGTILEVDSFPSRLDLSDTLIRQAIQAGVKLSIDTDAHQIQHLSFLPFGVAAARRGWAGRGDIINAWPLEKMLSFLKDRRSK